MNMSRKPLKTRGGSKNWLGYASILMAVVALLVSFAVGYNTVLKPFELRVHINPLMQLQHKGNLGIYLHVDLFNNSPRYGQITDAGLILYKIGSQEDKYLLVLHEFRVIAEEGVYTESEEELPLFFRPWERHSKTMNFLYKIAEEPFPVSSGTYEGELLLWTEYSTAAEYVEHFKFDITGDVLKLYLEGKELGSTRLMPLSIVGYTPLKSGKLTEHAYNRLH